MSSYPKRVGNKPDASPRDQVTRRSWLFTRRRLVGQSRPRILAAPRNLHVQTCDGFQEISHGHWEGMTRHEVEEKFPDEWPNGKRIRTHLRR